MLPLFKSAERSPRHCRRLGCRDFLFLHPRRHRIQRVLRRQGGGAVAGVGAGVAKSRRLAPACRPSRCDALRRTRQPQCSRFVFRTSLLRPAPRNRSAANGQPLRRGESGKCSIEGLQAIVLGSRHIARAAAGRLAMPLLSQHRQAIRRGRHRYRRHACRRIIRPDAVSNKALVPAHGDGAGRCSSPAGAAAIPLHRDQHPRRRPASR